MSARQVRFVPIALKKSFWGDEQNFLGPLMLFARGDVRDHIVSHKNDQGASYGRYAVLQWWSRLKISFCAIFASFNFRLLQQTLNGISNATEKNLNGFRAVLRCRLATVRGRDIRQRHTSSTGYAQGRSQGFWLWLQPPDLQALIPFKRPL
jgi:hypothetical protein